MDNYDSLFRPPAPTRTVATQDSFTPQIDFSVLPDAPPELPPPFEPQFAVHRVHNLHCVDIRFAPHARLLPGGPRSVKNKRLAPPEPAPASARSADSPPPPQRKAVFSKHPQPLSLSPKAPPPPPASLGGLATFNKQFLALLQKDIRETAMKKFQQERLKGLVKPKLTKPSSNNLPEEISPKARTELKPFSPTTRTGNGNDTSRLEAVAAKLRSPKELMKSRSDVFFANSTARQQFSSLEEKQAHLRRASAMLSQQQQQQQPAEELQVRLLRGLEAKHGSKQRAQGALEALRMLRLEAKGYEKILRTIEKDLERAVHCQRGELPDVIRNYKFRNLDVDDFLEGAEKVPWFEVSARLVAVIEDFARRAEQQRQVQANERKEMRERLKAHNELVQTLRADNESLKKLNCTNMNQQFLDVAEAKARLTSENDILKYDLSEFKKDKAEADTELTRLRHENASLRRSLEEAVRRLAKLKEEAANLHSEIQHYQSNTAKINDQKHQLILVLSSLKSSLATAQERADTLARELQDSAARPLTPRLPEWSKLAEELELGEGLASSNDYIGKLIEKHRQLKNQAAELRKKSDHASYPEINLSVKKKSGKRHAPQYLRDCARLGREHRLQKMQTVLAHHGNIRIISPPITPRGEGLSASVLENGGRYKKRSEEGGSAGAAAKGSPVVLESDTEELGRKSSVL